jgi:uncharacterized protein (TIGR02099 family)
MKVFGTIFRRAKTLLWTAFSILVIFAAVLMGIGKLLIPYSDRYQPRLEAWLSQEFGQPVVLESFVGEWTGFGPRLSLQGMKLLPRAPETTGGAQALQAEVVIEAAALDIKPLNLLLPGFPLYNFRVIGADFELLRGADGQFRLSGFGVSRRGAEQQGSALRDLARVGEVVLQDSSLVYRDEIYGIRLDFRDINGRLHLEGDELASEIRANLFDDRSALVVGEAEATILMSLGEGGGVVGVRWQATTRELMLAALQGRLPPNPFLPVTGWLNAELWGDWSEAGGHSVQGVADLADARLVNDHQDLWLDRVNTRFRWQFHNKKHWDLHLADFLYDGDGEQAWTAPRISMARNTADGLGLWISADWLPLGVPLRLTRDVMSIYGTSWPAFLPGSADGTVTEFDLVLDAAWGIELARGEVQGGGVADWGRWPDLQGLEGQVALGRNTGRLDLHGEDVLISWPGMFREPVSVTVPACTVNFDWGRRWQVGVPDCSLDNADLAAHGEAVISGNEGKPSIDLNVMVSRGAVGQLDPYWPEAVMKEPVKEWLRKGLVAGEADYGRVSIRGDMDDWPFRGGQGRFEAMARVNGGRIDYLEGWPHASDVDAVAHFVNASMDVQGKIGEIGGATVREVRAGIADFAQPELIIDYAADSEIPILLGFVQQTPLEEHIGADLSRFEFAGPANTTGRVEVPFARLEDGLNVDGSVLLSKGRFTDPELAITIGNIEGQLSYSERGFIATELDAEYQGRPARLDLKADADSGEPFRADLAGVFAVDDVIPQFLADDLSRLTQSAGECPWRIALVVSRGAESEDSQVMLLVTSELQGVSLDLPAPLGKPAEDSWPLNLSYPLSGTERVLHLGLDDRLAMYFDLPPGAGAPRSTLLRLGGGAAELPPAGLIRVEGEAADLDLDGWLDVILEEVRRGASMAGLALEQGEITARKLTFLDRLYDDVGISFSVAAPEVRAEFAGADLSGTVRFTTGAGGSNSLSAEFERLVLGEPVSTGMEMDTNPSELPTVHLYARSLRYGSIELGETRIEAFPIANGFHFDKIDAASERLKLQASGDWFLDEQGHRSDFDIHIVSESLGDFLQSMDIASPIQGGQTLVYFNAWWPGAPAAFALSRLNGEVEFSVVGGNITNASAGTGRLLGLLSVQALPKRLALDFRDVFDSGFVFDEAAGTFEMENGTASTDDVLLRSSSANISVTGSTNLVLREYDQLLTIRPGLGNTLPIIGALAAGPGGAAAGLALQGLLQQPLAEATQVRYAVTGSWEEPVFEAVAVERREAKGTAEIPENPIQKDSNEP